MIINYIKSNANIKTHHFFYILNLKILKNPIIEPYKIYDDYGRVI